ncbi:MULTISPECIES: putative entry exclusion protein TrbK-alt [Sphingomonadales]|uniref:Entry exclusion protein TrbK-alt n=1 Tax=Erythrobacter westpacificensis TaxID=1055231 RepID=A0ABP9KFX4_9SPHN|nr:putative entry exclusion protein TrbK-alt [Novosphingobium aquimarinum]
MDHKLLARIGAIIFVAIAVTMTAIEMSRAPEQPREEPVSEIERAGTDPLLAELRRCQGLGATGAEDRDCLAAWAENRRRFFDGSARTIAPADPAPVEEN